MSKFEEKNGGEAERKRNEGEDGCLGQLRVRRTVTVICGVRGGRSLDEKEEGSSVLPMEVL
jgi:hypothetical protein